MRFTKKIGVAAVLFGALATAPGTAAADGGQFPSGAPLVKVGTTMFGDTGNPDTHPEQDYFRLPTVLAQSRVTVSARVLDDHHDDDFLQMCLAGNVNDSNWRQRGCNLAPAHRFGVGGKKVWFTAAFATNRAFLRFFGDDEEYRFTVERIQHKLGMGIRGNGTFRRNDQVEVAVRTTNGLPVADGLPVNLVTRVGGRNYNALAYTRRGVARFWLNLPASAVGQRGTMIAFSGETPSFLPAAAGRAITVIK